MKNITNIFRKLYIIVSLLLILTMAGCSGIKTSKAEEQLALGKKNMEQEQYDDAIDCFYKAIENNHLCEEAYCGIVDSFMAQEKIEEAQFVLEKGIQVFTSEGMNADLLSQKQQELFGINTKTENATSLIKSIVNQIEENEEILKDDIAYEGVDLLNEVKRRFEVKSYENLIGHTISQENFVKTSQKQKIYAPLIKGLKKYVEKCEKQGLDSIEFEAVSNNQESESCELNQLYGYLRGMYYQCGDLENYKEYNKKLAVLEGTPEMFSDEAFVHKKIGDSECDVWYDEYGRNIRIENKDTGVISIMEFEENHMIFSQTIDNNPDNKYDIKKIYEYNSDGTLSKITEIEQWFDGDIKTNEATYSYLGNFIKKENSEYIPPFTYYLLDENGHAYDPYVESYEKGLEVFKDIIYESTYSDEELCDMVVNYHVSHHGKPGDEVIAKVVSKHENQVGIHVYNRSGEELSSLYWYFIDGTTLSGYKGYGYDYSNASPMNLTDTN